MQVLAQVPDPSKGVTETNADEPPTAPEKESNDQASEDEASRIKAFAADIRDQDELERNIGFQV